MVIGTELALVPLGGGVGGGIGGRRVEASPEVGVAEEPVAWPLDAPPTDDAVPWAVAGMARVAAEAADDAPSDLTIRPACTAVIPARPHPPTTPEATAACSTDGRSR